MFCSQLKSLSPSSGPNPDQFENLANMRAHERGTGAEIWRQTGGEIDAFVMSAGTAACGGGLLGYPSPLCSTTARHTGLLWRESPGVPALRA